MSLFPVIVVALDRRVFESAIYSLDLPIRPGVPWIDQVMVILLPAQVESKLRAWKVSPAAFAPLLMEVAEAILPGMVKWVPLSVISVCTL
jgi:hypothetical protein